jgi:hypothetical protein
MNPNVLPQRQARDIVLALALTVLFGMGIFFLFLLTTGWIFLSLLVAVAVLAVLGTAHYVLWGQAFGRSAALVRASEKLATPTDGNKENFMAEFNLSINERERIELLRILEQALGDTRVEVHHTHTPAYREDVKREESILRALLEKVRGFGA